MEFHCDYSRPSVDSIKTIQLSIFKKKCYTNVFQQESIIITFLLYGLLLTPACNYIVSYCSVVCVCVCLVCVCVSFRMFVEVLLYQQLLNCMEGVVLSGCFLVRVHVHV